MSALAGAMLLVVLLPIARDEADPPPHGRFAVRGRWESPRALTYRLDTDGGPVAADVLAATVERALATWSASGVVAFRLARDDEAATFSLSWHADEPQTRCRPFGQDLSVAHSGPMVPDTFIHLDASLEWSVARDVDGREGEPLYRTLLHEVGHVLGLDHCADPEALMYPDPQVDRPTGSDLAGLHSLYGGGPADGPGDLGLFRVGDDGLASRIAPVLRRVAPEDLTDVFVFDTDGDGDHEVLVWRSDPRSIGILMAYHFEPGPASEPALVRTVGPLIGAVPADTRTSFRTATDGSRWMISSRDDEVVLARSFDDGGWLRTATPEQTAALELAPAATPAAESAAAFPEGARAWRADLDGDGVEELVVRSFASS